MSRFLSEKFSSLLPYVPGEQPRDMQYIKLNTNESPFPPSPKAIHAMDRAAKEKLCLYPDPEGKELIEAVSEVYKIPSENIYVTGGSDEALFYAFLAFCDSATPAVFPDISYGFYPVLTDLLHIEEKKIPLRDGFELCPEDYYNAGGTVIIANPNAPTGKAISLSDIRGICEHNPDNVVIIDEAYVDFGAESALALLPECPNLLVIQTFSKSRSLAGGRISFSAASKEIIEDLNKMKFSINPYDITRLSLSAGAAAIRDVDYFNECRAKIIETRGFVSAELIKLGFDVIESSTNFIFAAPKKLGGREYYLELKKRGVLVRHFDKERIRDYVRITIGTREQMEKFLEATRDVLGVQIV